MMRSPFKFGMYEQPRLATALFLHLQYLPFTTSASQVHSCHSGIQGGRASPSLAFNIAAGCAKYGMLRRHVSQATVQQTDPLSFTYLAWSIGIGSSDLQAIVQKPAHACCQAPSEHRWLMTEGSETVRCRMFGIMGITWAREDREYVAENVNLHVVDRLLWRSNMEQPPLPSLA